MRKALRRVTTLVGSLALVAGMAMALPQAASASVGTSPRVLINEVYGGGGNSGATQTNDFVELYNGSGADVDLSTWSVQYASKAGGTWAVTPLQGTLPAGSSYLVLEAAGTGGTVTPTADVTGTIAMGGSDGKVALVSSLTALTCASNCTGDPAVVDFVGYGAANDSAGGHPATGATATKSVSRDASHTNTADNAADFSAQTPSPTACGAACVVAPPTGGNKTIAEIQGTGDASPLVGASVTTKGIVTAAYPTGGFFGFVIQTPGTGGVIDFGTHTASDGLYVYMTSTAGAVTVSVGDYVEVTGTVAEFAGLTELNVAAAGDVVTLTDTVAPVVPISNAWPGTDAQRESIESMLFAATGNYTVTNTYSTNQYGEVGLAYGTTPLIQWTDQAIPNSAAANAIKADNAARAVVLDDGSSENFLANGDDTPPYISQADPVRVGEAVTFSKNVIVDYRNNAWKLQPTSAIGNGTPVVPDPSKYPATWINSRTTTPDPALVGKNGTPDIKVASFNVLNFFTMTGEMFQTQNSVTCTSYKDRDGNSITVNTCPGQGPRGAWNQDNFKRQYDKTVAAINALGANVVGLMEMENSVVLGEPKDTSVSFLVDRLNAATAPGTWAYVSPPTSALPPVSEMDVINNAIIYQPAVVTPVGTTKMLADQSGTGEAFANAREPIAQVFAPVGGGTPFLFVVNHFKSKGSGSGPGNTDSGDGQGASNADRVAQANALVTWLNTVKTSISVDAVVSVGDYNSYGMEDPMQVLYNAGYTDAEQHFALGKYSYSFSGLSGSLDHALMNAAALSHATGADIWNINSPESVALQYSRYNYAGTNWYQADPYASSDHDPVVVGFQLGTTAPTSKTIQILGINDFHGRIQANGQEAGAAVVAGAVNDLRAEHPNTVFAGAGDFIGASTFESFIAHDKPTIDAMNAAGLEVSAVGNHEFDQGYNDLINRVMAPYDATTNPYGGAQWKYLGANVKLKASGNPAIDAVWTKTMDGVKVGFVGAVTEHLDELVSPAGIADLDITDIATAVNTEADALKADGAQLVIMLVHEGSPNTSCTSVTDGSNDFGKIVNALSDNVDAVISGHTHLTYNCLVDVSGWQQAGRAVTQRPVVSAGQYGYNLDQLLFTVSGTGELTGVQSNTIALTSLVPDPANPGKTIWVPNYAADGTVGAIVSTAVSNAATLGAVPLGQIAGPFNRAKDGSATPVENRGGESTLGNLVAEAQRWATQGSNTGSAQIAFMNPGGLRADMVGVAGGYPAVLTYQQAATVQPFANTLVNMTLTGAQIRTVLEQQWQPSGASRPFLKLGISKGFTYTYDPGAAAGDHILQMWLNGTPIQDAGTYSVTVNSFLAAGGDNFLELDNGTGKKDTGQTDLQGMVDYMAAMAPTGGTPLAVDNSQHSVGVHFPSGAPADYQPGGSVSFDLSSLMMSQGTATDSQVTVSLNGTTLGTFPVDNTVPVGTKNDEAGTASVTVTLPTGTPYGQAKLVVAGAATGTTTTVPITVTATAGDKVIQVLGINDFHGRIQANGQEAGAAVLAGAVKSLRATNPDTVFSAAGDLIGASTFESFIAHDKPTIDALNAAGLEVSAVGNHEFDQGYDDLMNRVIAPYNATTNPYGGAQWKYLGANVKVKSGSSSPALDPSWVKTMNGVKVGFVGAVTEHLDELVSPAGIADLDITNIATAVNAEADALKASGDADIVVMLVHEGSPTTSCTSVTDPSNDFGKIVNALDENVDAVISGHTHLTYNCMVDVAQWQAESRPVTKRPVVSAGQYGYNLDQLLFSVSPSGVLTGVQSNTLALTKQVGSTWVPNYAADGTVGAIVSQAVSNAAVLGAVPLGQITGPFNRAKGTNGVENRGGESTLGNLVAEAQRWATESATTGSAQIAFMNPGGLRADMVGLAGGYPATVTYQQAATVQPFANTLVNMTLTGAQIKTVLEQQWQPSGASRPFLKLGISEGFTYTYDPGAAAGSHILQMWLGGAPIEATGTYSVTVNSFLAAGGDNFFELANGTNKKDTGQTDLQGMVDYMAANATSNALPVDNSQRAVGVHYVSDEDGHAGGDTVSFDLTSLAMSTGTVLDTEVAVSLNGTSLGTFPVNNTVPVSTNNDEAGTASVTVTLPLGTPVGVANLMVTGAATGTVTTVPFEVDTFTFTDVAPGSLFGADIYWMAGQGITQGYPDGSFQPTAPMGRQEIAAFLYRMMHPGAPDAVCDVNAVRTFTDVPASNPFCGDIEAIAAAGITQGTTATTFDPTGQVNREQMAAFLYRMAHPGAAAPTCTGPQGPFTDVPVSSIFCGYITWLKDVGITLGKGDGTFGPFDAMLRQTVAAMLHRYSQTGA